MSITIYLDLATGQPAPMPQHMAGINCAGAIVRAATLDKARQDAERRDAIIQQGVIVARMDAANPDLGAFALALTHREREILDEPVPPLNSEKMFQVYPVPAGNIEYTTPYRQRSGEAAVYQYGTAIPMVNVSGFENKAPVVNLVCGYSRSYFQELAASVSQANIGMAVATTGDLMRAARTILNLKANAIAWSGLPDHGVPGILTYPSLDKRTLSVAIATTSTPTDIADEIIALGNYAISVSSQVYQPNRMVTSPRLARFLKRTLITATQPMTIGEFIEKALGMKIEEAWELKNAGGTGIDGYLFYNDARDSTAIVKASGLVMHQPYTIGLETVQPLSMSVGGARMALPGSNTLGLADCSTLQ